MLLTSRSQVRSLPPQLEGLGMSDSSKLHSGWNSQQFFGTVLCRFDTYIFLMGDKSGYWKCFYLLPSNAVKIAGSVSCEWWTLTTHPSGSLLVRTGGQHTWTLGSIPRQRIATCAGKINQNAVANLEK